jgi:hypothetical protein
MSIILHRRARGAYYAKVRPAGTDLPAFEIEVLGAPDPATAATAKWVVTGGGDERAFMSLAAARAYVDTFYEEAENVRETC